MRKENVNLIMLLCLLLSFCSGFASCGDDEEEEYDPCAPFEVALEKADAVYTESNTLYDVTNMFGELLIRKVDGKIQYQIYYRLQDGSELYVCPVNLPESLFPDSYYGDSFSVIAGIWFSGEVKLQLEGMEYNPIVLTYAEIILICNLATI
ncbi:hypothetical protein H8784_18880 [Parabacteroides acidifaciens]|uniref:Uncharacterized protein n=2 Tax=Parabacteroides acidifaciens TaxID=2290935 RepID=A0ABR7P7G3_9BACT|nr:MULTISPECIES: hypothetical protein [Parabacteroides]MBC8603777.1 hypothetical protein [Parabacteroides acidifaciens]